MHRRRRAVSARGQAIGHIVYARLESMRPATGRG
jgi:hypothetical protein